jgi:PemK-like, MazF-like toxin of type II toxin-antitoxin system
MLPKEQARYKFTFRTKFGNAIRAMQDCMALSFVPHPGSIVICDFNGHVQPEMVKMRRVVVVSPIRSFRNRTDATVIVVPLSEVQPLPVRPWHPRSLRSGMPGSRRAGRRAISLRMSGFSGLTGFCTGVSGSSQSSKEST